MLLAGGLLGRGVRAGESKEWPARMPTVKIHQVYVGRTGGIYLSRPTEEIAKFEKYLAKIEQQLGDVKFVGGEVVPPAEVEKVVVKLGQADGLLLFHLSGHGGGAPVQAMEKVVDAGLPTAVVSQPFSGHGWMYFPKWQKEGKKVVLLPTSDWDEIDEVVGLMRVAPRLRQTRIIVVGKPRGTETACTAEQVKERLGAEIVPISNEQVIEAHQAIDIKAAEAEAEQYWIRLCLKTPV